jgi:uncharacterized membrane protein YhhN
MTIWQIIAAGCVLLAAASALVQGLLFRGQPASLFNSLSKTLAVAALAVSAALLGAPEPIVAGLALGAAGDFALSRPAKRAFLAGMAAFGAGHLAYVWAFVALGSALPVPLAALAMLVVLGLSTEFWLIGQTGSLRWPVRIYVVVILMMALAALALPADRGWLKAGVLLFVLSDLVLALERFVLRAPFARRVGRHLLWLLYWPGQLLILLGALS